MFNFVRGHIDASQDDGYGGPERYTASGSFGFIVAGISSDSSKPSVTYPNVLGRTSDLRSSPQRDHVSPKPFMLKSPNRFSRGNFALTIHHGVTENTVKKKTNSVQSVTPWFQYLRRNIEEIARDPALRIYGIALSLLHVLCFLNWDLQQQLTKILDPARGSAVCWPFFEDCHDWRVFSEATIERVLWIYLGFALLTAMLFIRRKTVPAGWWVLIALNVFKTVLFFQDYRLRLNQHYMMYWVTLAFLFAPYKRSVIPYLVAAFYFWSGTLKFTPDWISGNTLYGLKPLGVPQSLIPASCIYVIFLELVVVFGLLVRNRWIFWIAMLQFVAFHISSWTVVGFFYPSLMFGILTIFILTRYLPDPDPADKRLSKLAIISVVAVFSLFQVVPYLFPGDRSITGEGRMFALHMFDTPPECSSWAVVHEPNGNEQKIPLEVPYLPTRINCDPIVYFSLANALCDRLSNPNQPASIDVYLRTRRYGEENYHRVIEQPEFCASDLHYDIWRSNSWILK